MQSFDRVPFFYWADRICLLVLLVGAGALCLAAVQSQRAELDPLVAIVAVLVGVAAAAAGVWAFFWWPWPKRIEVDGKEVRVVFGARKPLVIPRAKFIRASYGSLPTGGGGNAIEYTVGKKKKFIRIYAHYRGEDGKISKGWEITNTLNTLLATKK